MRLCPRSVNTQYGTHAHRDSDDRRIGDACVRHRVPTSNRLYHSVSLVRSHFCRGRTPKIKMVKKKKIKRQHGMYSINAKRRCTSVASLAIYFMCAFCRIRNCRARNARARKKTGSIVREEREPTTLSVDGDEARRDALGKSTISDNVTVFLSTFECLAICATNDFECYRGASTSIESNENTRCSPKRIFRFYFSEKRFHVERGKFGGNLNEFRFRSRLI